ncbi:MAG: response regulator transcription factor [Phycisphaerales bacterium]|nr:response regulator transcription factor [Phycisphaerales bacterium]
MADRPHILVVEDERDLADLLIYNLQRAGYLATGVSGGRAALEVIARNQPDLILLDVMIPELPGTEVAARLRSDPATASIPLIMVTAKGEETDQIVGLKVGADDYVTKPFSMKVLLARVEALLRRSGRLSGDRGMLRLGAIEVNTDTHQATLDGQLLKLTLTEFRILAALLQASGRVLSRNALMSRAMGPGVTVTERTIDVHVTSIRKKLLHLSHVIKTVRGVGYRASLEHDESDAETGDLNSTAR